VSARLLPIPSGTNGLPGSLPDTALATVKDISLICLSLTLYPFRALPLRPLPQQRHHARPQHNTRHHKPQSPPIHRPLRIEQEVPRQQLHQPSIYQNTRTETIQHATNDARREAAGVVRRAHAQADGDGKGRGESVGGAEEPGEGAVAGWEGDGGEAGADAEAFEGLML
jgi:hypothetical protein